MEDNGKKRQRRTQSEITQDNYYEFSSKALFAEILRLRIENESVQDLKKELKHYRQNMTRIANLAVGKKEE